MYWIVRIFWLVVFAVFVCFKLIVLDAMDWYGTIEWSTIMAKASVICVCLYMVFRPIPAKYRIRAFASCLTLLLVLPYFLAFFTWVFRIYPRGFRHSLHHVLYMFDRVYPIPLIFESNHYRIPEWFFSDPAILSYFICSGIPLVVTYLIEEATFDDTNFERIRDAIPKYTVPESDL